MGKYIIACKASNSFLNNIYLSGYKTQKIFFLKWNTAIPLTQLVQYTSIFIKIYNSYTLA